MWRMPSVSRLEIAQNTEAKQAMTPLTFRITKMEPVQTALEYIWGVVLGLAGPLGGFLTMRMGRAERATDKAFEKLDAHIAEDRRVHDETLKTIHDNHVELLTFLRDHKDGS